MCTWKGKVEVDPEKAVIVLDHSSYYAEVVEIVRIEFNWMDPSDVVELEGMHNVRFEMHIH